MTEERFLVTGAAGFIGAWVTRNLLRAGRGVVAFDLANDRRRMNYLMSESEIARISFIRGDITDTAHVRETVVSHDVTHIIHLAALQVPFCRENPVRGAQVNVVGTANVFDAAKTSGLQHLSYASSAAVYGAKEEYGRKRPVDNSARLRPRTHYGVYKQANEGMARVYWLNDEITSIGLRPYVVYGVGRDQGLTSAPSMAMLASVLGEAYHISYGGRFNFQYADDVANCFIEAACTPYQGAGAYNLRGCALHMRDVVAAIETVKPQMAGKITYAEESLPFPPDLSDRELVEVLGSVPHTPLIEGVKETVTDFSRLVDAGMIGRKALQ